MKSFSLLWLALVGCSAQSTHLILVAKSTTIFGLASATGPTVALNLSASTTRQQVQPKALGFTVGWVAADVSGVSIVAGPALTGTGKTLQCTAGTASQVCTISGGTATIPNGVAAIVNATASKTTALVLSGASAINKFGVPLLTAITPGGTITVPIIVVPVTLASIICAAPQIESGEDVACTAKLLVAAPAAGATIELVSSVPASVVLMSSSGSALTTLQIPAGAISASFVARGM